MQGLRQTVWRACGNAVRSPYRLAPAWIRPDVSYFFFCSFAIRSFIRVLRISPPRRPISA